MYVHKAHIDSNQLRIKIKNCTLKTTNKQNAYNEKSFTYPLSFFGPPFNLLKQPATIAKLSYKHYSTLEFFEGNTRRSWQGVRAKAGAKFLSKPEQETRSFRIAPAPDLLRIKN